jgi:hypothetical protein
VTVKDSWMRLDIDNDGSVSLDDLKASLGQLYTFLHDFDLLERTTIFKDKLYTDAIAFMKKELENDEKARQLKAKQKEDDQKGEEKLDGKADEGGVDQQKRD